MAFNYDLILKGGEVVDASLGLHATRDVGFKDGKVSAVATVVSMSYWPMVSRGVAKPRHQAGGS